MLHGAFYFSVGLNEVTWFCRYLYKFIVGGQWRHSNSLPTESDRWGNVNNVIKIGGEAVTRFETPTRGGVKV